MDVDLAARKILVAAFCYYELSESVMSDGDYDALSNYVADNWNALHPDRQFCLGDAESVRASGHRFKFTTLCVAAAYKLLADLNINPEHAPNWDDGWTYDKQVGHYCTTKG